MQYASCFHLKLNVVTFGGLQNFVPQILAIALNKTVLPKVHSIIATRSLKQGAWVLTYMNKLGLIVQYRLKYTMYTKGYDYHAC